MVEKEWITKAGSTAAVVINPMGHRCGYVKIERSNSLYWMDYMDAPRFNVHGGVTYSDSREIEGTFWYGFHCNHVFDAQDPALMDKELLAVYQLQPGLLGNKEKIRSLEYCIEECEKLAEQLANFEK